MAGVRDLFEKGKGLVERGMELAKEKSADVFDRVRGSGSPVRDAEPRVSNTIETPEARHSRVVNEMNARQSAKSAAQGRPLSKPRFVGPQATVGAAPEITVASPAEQAAKKVGMRGRLATAGKALGIAGAGLAVGDAAMKAQAGQTAEQQANISGGIVGGGIEALDTVTGGLGRPFVHAASAGIGHIAGDEQSEAAVARDPRVGIRHSAGRFLTAVGEGWKKGSDLNNAGVQARPQPLPQPAQAGAMMPPAQRVADVQVPGDERLDPNAMLDNPRSAVPVGTGAFRRTGARDATLVDSRPALRAQEAQVAADSRMPRTPAGVLGGLASRMAKVKSEQGKQSQANFEAGMGIKQQDANTRSAQAVMAARAAREKTVSDEIKNEVVRDPELSKLPKEEREAATNQRTADLAQRFVRSAASQGKQLGDLSTVETSQLRVANKFRERLVANRGSFDSFTRDFFGNKRFDHENLYSYIPAAVEDAPMGAILTMRGGNQVRVNKVVRNGETHWFSPNDPTDTDLTDLVEIARKSTKGSK